MTYLSKVYLAGKKTTKKNNKKQTKTKKHLLYVVNHKHEQSIYLYYSSPRDVSFYTLSLLYYVFVLLVELQLICNALSSFSHWFTLLTAIYAMDPGPDVGVYSSFVIYLFFRKTIQKKPIMELCIMYSLDESNIHRCIIYMSIYCNFWLKKSGYCRNYFF